MATMYELEEEVRGEVREVVFNIVSNSQFYITWEAWVRGKGDGEEGNDEEDICSDI